MYKSIFIIIFSSLLAISGCATQQRESLSYFVEYKEPNRIKFSGRGAGAGMMMSGSMGPMGIAIGFAIDEGIAKDIAKTAENVGLEFDGLFRESHQAHQTIENRTEWVNSSSKEGADMVYQIESYGFISKGDLVYPEIILIKSDALGNQTKVSIPKDFLGTENENLLPSTSYSEIKVNVEEIKRLWSEGIHLILRTDSLKKL